jgi:endonuclease YncB( thermonuclease family)
MAALLVFPASEAFAQRKSSKSGYRQYRGAKAVDGDTFRYRGQRYRVQTYNAPELGQPGSRKATRSLQRQLDSGSTTWKPVARDAYGRKIVKPSRTRK